ncbi:biopolymer transport protein ExbB [Paracandidimonas soli]|uniref:Biopolymer transport protein ExbB n=1 Tax=Paracandidimonas soli TaxID=1917182 RepID=A0A4V2VSA2_9BURK|nr:biopolymer transport protein ExbB [Paracandidimonas soli]
MLPSPVPPEPETEPTLLEIIDAAGWPIWLLIAASVICLALILERLLSLRQARIAPARLAEHVAELALRRTPSPEALRKLSDNSALGRVLAEVFLQRDKPESYRIAAIESTGRDMAMRLNRYLPALGTIAVVAPLLGLFGTVVGMIEIFASFTPEGGDPAQLARGISVALYNTAFGIIIAIPALVFHRLFRTRVDGYLHRMERDASALDRLLDDLADASREPRQ